MKAFVHILVFLGVATQTLSLGFSRSPMKTVCNTNKNPVRINTALNSVVSSIAVVPVLYSLMSVNEYITHRYYQHAEFNKNPMLQFLAKIFNLPSKIRGGGHVEHHAETYDDMTLKTDEAWRKTPAAISLDNDVYRGTAFTWEVTALMAIQMVPTTVPVFHFLFGFSFLTSMAIITPAILLHALIWNSLHPHMHGLPEVPFFTGPPSELLAKFRQSSYFKYLYQNHEGHHVVGGQGNYNVCCPLTDHLVGTYVKEAAWKPRQLASLTALAMRRGASLASAE